MTEKPNGHNPENGLPDDIYQRVDEIAVPLQLAGLIPESAEAATKFAIYTELATGVTNLSAEQQALLQIATSHERRNLPFPDITSPVQTTIITTTEPTHEEALQRYGFAVVAHESEQKKSWTIVLPPTLSNEMQALMLRQLQRLNIVLQDQPSDTSQQIVLPFYVNVLPRESLTPEMLTNEEITNGIATLHNMLSLAYASTDKAAGVKQMLSTEVLLTEESIMLGIFAFFPDDNAITEEIIRANQILGTAFLEWMRLQSTSGRRPTLLKQSIAESMGTSIEKMRTRQVASIMQAREIIRSAVKDITDFLYPEDEEEV